MKKYVIADIVALVVLAARIAIVFSRKYIEENDLNYRKSNAANKDGLGYCSRFVLLNS